MYLALSTNGNTFQIELEFRNVVVVVVVVFFFWGGGVGETVVYFLEYGRRLHPSPFSLVCFVFSFVFCFVLLLGLASSSTDLSQSVTMLQTEKSSFSLKLLAFKNKQRHGQDYHLPRPCGIVP